jgi:pyruvate dehydrogenase E2 component (dihydrolipoamide acetyltransferase)
MRPGRARSHQDVMMTEFRLPELGENIEAGDLVKVLVSVGQSIAKDQSVVELETDKATIEVPSAVSGRVKEIHVKQGDKVKVGQLILTVEDGGGAARIDQAQPSKTAPRPATPARPQPLQAEPPGANRPAVAEARTGEPAEPERRKPAASPMVETGQALEPRAAQRVVPAAPSVRRHARELGVDVSQVPGSGPGGRISSKDVTNYARQIISLASTSIPGALVAAPPLPDFTRWGEVERQPMSNVRRKTAEHMTHAWTSIPHVTQFDKADVTELEELRQRFRRRAEEAGGKLSMTAIAVKVAVSALRAFPQFAASVDVAKKEIVYKKYFHIGVAVDTERGLLVPVIRDADRKNIIELSVELARLAEKARTKKLTPEEMEGGVFTITNLGGIGGTGFSPIVNSPEVAILGMARASLQPVFVDGQFVPRLVLPLSVSYDHRLIDGADAARFLRWVAEALEQPFLLPLEG